jgi:cation transport regulator ChaB
MANNIASAGVGQEVAMDDDGKCPEK